MFDELNVIHALERTARRSADEAICPAMRAVHRALADRHAETAWALLNRLPREAIAGPP